MADTSSGDAPEPSGDGADRIRQARVDKLARLENAGVRAYPTTFARTHRAQEINAGFDRLEGQQACVAGRLAVFKILSKNLPFVFLQDESGQIQLILHPPGFDGQTRLVYDALDPAHFVGACAKLVKCN